jgi:UDP-glucose 4-epimerase
MKKYVRMNILVTGGAGYIGSHLIHFMIKNGYDPSNVFVFDNLVNGHREFLPDGVNFIRGDLLYPNDIDQVFGNRPFDAVIHFAAYAYIGESYSDPGKYFKNNLQGTLNLLESMRKHGVDRIVFSSTCAVYGIPEKNPITEYFPLNPVNPYGASKRMAEDIISWYDRIYGIKSVKLRYFNAAGAAFGIGECHNPEPHLIPKVISGALSGNGTVEVFGTDYDTQDGTCVRDFVHVCDLARAHLLALDYLADGRESETFNLGLGAGVSVNEIISLVRKISGKNFNVSCCCRRPGDPPQLVADYSKISGMLGWRPHYDIEMIIKTAYQWHLEGAPPNE